jgi:hypothetical protein
VVVDKQLTFRGSTKASDGRCKNPVVPDPNKDSIVNYPSGAPSAGFDVQVDGVVIAGFIVQPQNTVTFDGWGIYSRPGVSGTIIRDNIAHHNSVGVRLNNGGAAQAVVMKNCARDNNLGITLPFFSPLKGQGIFLDSGTTNVLIRHNFTTLHTSDAHTEAGINVSYGVSDVTIRDNKSITDDSAIAIFDSTGIYVRHNKSTDSTGSAIYIASGNTDLHLISNHLKHGDFYGIDFDSQSFPPLMVPSVAPEVRDNHIEHMGETGIIVNPDSLIMSTLAKNHAHDNGADGLHIEAGALPGGNGMNLITENKLKHNTDIDCFDDTTGAGTGGTANTWTKDEGDTQNRDGLCKHATTQ